MQKNNIIIFFDEIITGLRDSKNSFQSRFKFKPNLSVFGKSFAVVYQLMLLIRK